MPESVNEVLSRIPEKSEWARLRRSASLASLDRVGDPVPHSRPFTGPGRRPGPTPGFHTSTFHWTGSETRFHTLDPSLDRVGDPVPHPVSTPRLFTGPGRRPGSTPSTFHWTGSETRSHGDPVPHPVPQRDFARGRLGII